MCMLVSCVAVYGLKGCVCKAKAALVVYHHSLYCSYQLVYQLVSAVAACMFYLVYLLYIVSCTCE